MNVSSMSGPGRCRLDDLLVEKGLAGERKEALALILKGVVLVNEQLVTKAGTPVSRDATIRLKQQDQPYVSRSGQKLEGALEAFQIDVDGLTCWDLGASTGGFTDCLLQRGARRVYAVDVGKGQLHWNLQKDERVVLRDGINVRFLNLEQIGEEPDLVTVDLSFISLRLVLPVLKQFSPLSILALVKPQFEARRSEVEAGGLIRDETTRERIIERLRRDLEEQGIRVVATSPSVLEGRKGNREHFFLCSV